MIESFRDVAPECRKRCGETGSYRGGGRAPLSGSFQSDPAGRDPMDVEAFAMDGDMMVIPAETDQIVGVGISSVGPGEDMMDNPTR